MTPLISSLRHAAGNSNVITDAHRARRFATGFRHGSGPVAAVVTPRSLVAMWRTLVACARADAVVIMQAANTGLTGGSTPDGDDYDRPVVIVSPMAIRRIHLIDGGRQVVCLPGTTLYELEAALKPLGREPHSVIGSSCIGASVVGGVCNNSGGSLIRRGPAYTELALYARRDADGTLALVNHLGVRLPDDPEAMLDRLERGEFTEADLLPTDAVASDADYHRRIREIDAPTPARFNADPGRLHEASGSAGRVAIFAVRLDTFPAETGTATFYVGTNDPARLSELRRTLLASDADLPIAAEYMHRDCFDIAATYGKDMFVAIDRLGTARLPALFRLKASADRWAERLGLGAAFSDRMMQRIGGWLPQHLPRRMIEFRDRFEHHLILKVPAATIARTTELLEREFGTGDSGHFRCTEEEGAKAFLHRFAAAGAAIRYSIIHADTVEGVVALDIALRRNDRQWVETLPDDVADPIVHRLYYGHFFCHVFHQDYIVRKGTDCLALEHRMWDLLDARGAEYPAEHNVGHLYHAKPALCDHYRTLDPTNSFNPGIGHTPKLRDWA